MIMLFSPVTIGSLRLPNRIVIPPMCQYSATGDGAVTDWHLMHYGTLAFSGAGLLLVEATAVEPEGRISGNDLGIWSDRLGDGLGDLVRRIRAYSSLPLGIQLGHAGRKGARLAFVETTLSPNEGGWQVVAPSAISYGEKYSDPMELDQSGIDRIIDSFASAAARADRAGFDTVEIHSAHGYLLHQFLSPISNRRQDAYGGSLENRLRFPLAVFDAVRAAFPAVKPVTIRISGSDWVEGGWNVEESAVFSRELEKRGCACIHVSGGGLSLDQTLRVGPGYMVPMARAIRQAVSIPVIAVGLITEAEQAETVLEAGDADLVAIGRGMLYDPRWPWHAAERLGCQVTAPVQYHRSKPHRSPNLFEA